MPWLRFSRRVMGSLSGQNQMPTSTPARDRTDRPPLFASRAAGFSGVSQKPARPGTGKNLRACLKKERGWSKTIQPRSEIFRHALRTAPLHGCPLKAQTCVARPQVCGLNEHTCNVFPHICRTLPQTCNAFPHIYRTLPLTCNAFPHICRTLPQTCNAFPHICRTLPHICRTLPQTCNVFPHICRTLPQTCNAFPHTCRTLPQTCNAFPHICRTLPLTCGKALQAGKMSHLGTVCVQKQDCAVFAVR